MKLLSKVNNNIRLITQVAFTALTNGYVNGFLEGTIYGGESKKLCVPGLNCYSCPGALGMSNRFITSSFIKQRV